MATKGTEVHYRACNLCEAICGLEIRVEKGEITSIRGDEQDPFSRGHICPKAVALQDIHNDPDRLRHPMRRTENGWQRIGWSEAFDLAADRLRRVQDEHGFDAVAVYSGNPNVHNYGSLLFGPPLLKALRTRNRYSATSVDQLPHHLAAVSMFGHQLLIPIPDLDHTDFLLVMGGNPVVSNGSLMTAPDMKKRLRAIRERGGEVVVVDPRHTETARLASRHHFVRPGTDALLLLGLLATIFEEGLSSSRLSPLVNGESTLRELVQGYSPERVASKVGIEATEIRRLARDFATAESAVCYGRMGLSVQGFGTLCQWLVNTLNIVTGNFDRPGGALFTRPAADLVERGASRGSRGRWTSRVRGLPEFGGELPVATLADEILTEGEGQVRALVTSAGNPVLSTPNGRRLDRALASLDWMVSIDFYINETTRHAHLILPPTAALEHEHYDLVFNALAIRNTARLSEPLFEPEGGTRHDWQIFHALRQRLDRRQGFKHRFQRWATGRLGPRGLLDLALRFGPYGKGFWPGGLSLRRLRKHTHGLDLGPLRPSLPGRLKTRDGRIELTPELFVHDLERLQASLDKGSAPLVLIGRRDPRTNNSWMHNSARLMRGKERCTLLVHPSDAERLGLTAGQPARLRSRVGEVQAPVEISDEVMAGVVSLPHGWGHDREGIRLGTASRTPGVSVNDLTDHERIDALSGNAALNGVPVEISPIS